MGADISVAAAVFLVALGAWQDLWQSMADQARALLLDQPAAAGAPADGVSFGGTSLHGGAANPLLTVHDVVLRGESEGQTWQWHVGEVILSLHPNDVRRIEASLPSPQEIYAQGPLGRTAITLFSRNLDAAITVSETGRLSTASATADGLTLIAPGAEAQADMVRLSMEQRADHSIGLLASLERVLLPEKHRLAPPMGGTVDSVELDAWANGLTPSAPPSATAWRSAGGAIGVTDFSVDWGPFRLTLDGRAALDSQLRPEGRFTVNAMGLGDALASAHASDLIGSKTYRGISGALERIGNLRGTGPADDVRLTFAMAGGLLNWSGLPLARLPSFGADDEDLAVAPCDMEQAAC